jgi:hypothetical protein
MLKLSSAILILLKRKDCFYKYKKTKYKKIYKFERIVVGLGFRFLIWIATFQIPLYL